MMCLAARYVWPADNVTREKNIQKKGTPWMMRVSFEKEIPANPTFVVPVCRGPGCVFRKVQTRIAVLINPTSVAKLIRTSKNFSTLCISPMDSWSIQFSEYGRIVTRRLNSTEPFPAGDYPVTSDCT